MSRREPDYERFTAKRLDGTPKAVHLEVRVMSNEYREVWIPRSVMQLVQKPDRADGDFIIDVERWWALKNLYE